MASVSRSRARFFILVTLLFCALVAYAAVEARQYLAESAAAGKETTAETEEPSPPHWPRLTRDERRELVERLESLGYMEAAESEPGVEGVTVHDPALVCPGFNVCVTGGTTEVTLRDMHGEVLHLWEYDFYDVWPDFKLETPETRQWRYAHLLPDGSILAIHEGCAIVKLDKDSNIVWARLAVYHHDLDVKEDGAIYILARKCHLIPRITEDFPIMEAFVCVLNPDGEELRRISILEMLENSDYRHIVDTMNRHKPYIFHSNAVQYLDGSLADLSPWFKKGNVLVSLRETDTIAIADLEQERVVWAKQGPWVRQHEPFLLSNGHIVLFDNRGLGERSRVVEYDPLADEIVWAYGGGDGENFYSEACGYAQRLPNGNTLVSVTNTGQGFEVTPDKQVVWEYNNPVRLPHGDKSVRGALFAVYRIPPDFPLDWMSP